MADFIKIKNPVSQNFTGTGASAKYTLSNTPIAVTRVTINGANTTAYTVSGNTVTLTAASGAAIVVYYNYWMAVPTIKGTDGMSAYQAAVKGGYTGNETSFYTAIASVSGKQATITATGILKGNGNGNITSAVAGSDYAVPSGNVASATKLQKATNIHVRLDSTSNASFDGTTNITPGVYGVLPVGNGGTGNSGVDTTPVSGSTKMVTSGGIYNALAGKANSSHNQSANTITEGTFAGSVYAVSGTTLNNAQVRNIYAGTNDIGSGASLATGVIYLVYEA